MPHPRAPLPTAEMRLLARLADELGDGLKQLAAHYVAEARAGGATWNEIGRSASQPSRSISDSAAARSNPRSASEALVRFP